MSALLARSKELTLEYLALHFGPVELHRPLSREEFVALAERCPDLGLEREKNGAVTVMSPVKRGSSKRESSVIALLYVWNDNLNSANAGEVHGSTGGFDLPDGTTKSPDLAWISPERLAAAPQDEEEDFVKIVPDFVAEVRPRTDRLKKLQKKMSDSWMANGVRLAWLIDPYEEKVHIYRQGKPVEIESGFAGKKLSGEDVLPGFELPLDKMRAKQ
jgi:Uma2 family endonuclease